MNLEGVRPKESIHLDLNFIYQKLQHIFMKYRRRETSIQFWGTSTQCEKAGAKERWWSSQKDSGGSKTTLLSSPFFLEE